jgi:hypothetical protein
MMCNEASWSQLGGKASACRTDCVEKVLVDDALDVLSKKIDRREAVLEK